MTASNQTQQTPPTDADWESFGAWCERDREDAARWRMLPAFLEEYQINYLALLRDIDAAIADKALAKAGVTP